MAKPRRKPAPTHTENRGRPALPSDTRRVTLSVRVPQRTRDILDSRVKAHLGNSSLGLEVERAVDASSRTL